MRVHGLDLDVNFEGLPEDGPNWRDELSEEDDTDPDDEEMEVTPPDVVAMLGFDPKELF